MSDTPEPDETFLSVCAAVVAVWGGVALLAVGCVTVPVAAAVWVSPWLGLPLAAGSFWVWARLGPRPFPGFLPGVICLWGFAAIAGTFLLCAALAVRSLWAEPGAAADPAT